MKRLSANRTSDVAFAEDSAWWRKHRLIFVVLVVGLVLRLGYIWSMRHHPMFEPVLPGYDMTVFHEWAGRIPAGNLAGG